MIKLVKNITVDVTYGYEGSITMNTLNGEYGEGDFINLTNHIGFYQDLEYAEEIKSLDIPPSFGLKNNGRIRKYIEISY